MEEKHRICQQYLKVQNVQKNEEKDLCYFRFSTITIRGRKQ
jgi:hypothetical protein